MANEEEIAGIERPERHAGLSGEYLLQALDGLHDAGDPAHLFAHWRRFPPDDPAKVENEMHCECVHSSCCVVMVRSAAAL